MVRMTPFTHTLLLCIYRPTLNGTLGPNWCDPEASFSLNSIQVNNITARREVKMNR